MLDVEVLVRWSFVLVKLRLFGFPGGWRDGDLLLLLWREVLVVSFSQKTASMCRPRLPAKTPVVVPLNEGWMPSLIVCLFMVFRFRFRSACVLTGVNLKNKTGLGKKSVRAPRSPQPETYGVTLAHTGVGHTDSVSAQHFWLRQKHVFLCS